MRKLQVIICWCCILAFFPLNNYGQNPEIKRTWHWYFGYGAGMDFSGGNPVAVTNGQLVALEGCASIADMNGNLALYTDGDTVWNKNHVVMPNGFDIGGRCSMFGLSSSTQSAIIVPQPWSDSLYYIFTTDCWEDSLVDGFRYATVDMSLQGGLGDVTSKDNLLVAPASEKVTAAHHQNNDAIWVIAHQFGSDSFYSYLVSSSGLNVSPVVSSVGSIHDWPTGRAGYLKASPDGARIACAIQGMGLVELFDFDRATGSLSNAMSLNAVSAPYGVGFSPDGNKLYVSNIGGTMELYQFDLLAGNASDINNSAMVVGVDSFFVSISFGALQLAPDSNIYLVRNPWDSLGVVTNPDVLGLGCSYVNSAFKLAGKVNGYGLPNFIATYFGPEATGNEERNEKDVYKVTAYPNPFTESTTITYYVPESSNKASLIIYDLQGKQIKEFPSLPTGEGNVMIKGRELYAGIFIYVLIVDGEEIANKRMILTN